MLYGHICIYNYIFVLYFSSVDDGAIMDVIFDSFRCPQIPSGFDRIMVEKALL